MEETIHSQSDCDNCGTPLEGIYCHHCGQRKIDFRKDWNGILHEFLASFWHFDGKFLQGLLELTFTPWRLTKRYLEGKRASQIPPLRTYLFVSLLFFLAFSYDNSDAFMMPDEGQEVANIQVNGPTENTLEEWLLEKLSNQQAIEATFSKWFPRVFLLGVVVLALMSRIAFFDHYFVYIEHLVIALHLQSFAFIWILFSEGWSRLFGLFVPIAEDYLNAVFMIWLFLCPLIAYKNIFQSSKRRALAVGILIEVCYLFYLLTGLIGVAVLSLLLS
jgi:hypothetical protein